MKISNIMTWAKTPLKSFTDEEIYETMTSVFDKMNANASLVNDAYESIKPNILIINEETEKHKDEFGLKLNINKPKK